MPPPYVSHFVTPSTTELPWRVATRGTDNTRAFSVQGVQYKSGTFANLKVFGEPGDPYSQILSHLRHGDEIVCTG